MNAVPFNTLLLSQRLEQAGFSAGQAQGTAAALAEAFGQFLTRNYLEMRLRELEQRVVLLEQRMAMKFGGVLAPPWR